MIFAIFAGGYMDDPSIYNLSEEIWGSYSPQNHQVTSMIHSLVVYPSFDMVIYPHLSG